MTLLIAILLIHGLSMSPGWYIVACFLWAIKQAVSLAAIASD